MPRAARRAHGSASRRRKRRRRDRSDRVHRASHTSAFLTSATNAPILAASLMPLEDSTPLDTSTAQGRTRRIASPTLSRVSPPDSTSGWLPPAGTSDQSKLLPTPPYASS